MLVEGIDIGVRIDGRTVLHAETVHCAPGRLTTLVGPSGSGKTTLLNCLGLLQRPDQGRVLLDGRDTSSWNDRRRRAFWRREAAFVLQDYGVIEEESVAFNVTMSGRRRGTPAQRDRFASALEVTGLSGRDAETVAHLSGGEKQRLAVARAIFKDAQVILVDEPTASLDAENRDRVISLLHQRAAAGCTVIVASHDLALIESGTDRHQIGRTPAAVGAHDYKENR